MSSGSVRICGERGLVAFCPNCKNWEPIAIEQLVGPGGGVEGRNGLCATCEETYPPVPTYEEPRIGPITIGGKLGYRCVDCRGMIVSGDQAEHRPGSSGWAHYPECPKQGQTDPPQ